jgi:hypothetical protein
VLILKPSVLDVFNIVTAVLKATLVCQAVKVVVINRRVNVVHGPKLDGFIQDLSLIVGYLDNGSSERSVQPAVASTQLTLPNTPVL